MPSVSFERIKRFVFLRAGKMCCVNAVRISTGWPGQCLVFLLFLTSCEKVIEVNLNDAEKKYVIEGIITNEPGVCKVHITQTVNFDETNDFPPVSGARVTVKDNNESPLTLVESSPGIYQTINISGGSGHTYTLTVMIDGKIFTSTCIMPPQISLDSLFVEDFKGFGDPVKLANVVFQDPPGKGNAYRFVQYKNGVQNKNIFVVNDNFSDGRINTIFLTNFGADEDESEELFKNDTVKIEMQCIDANVYKYWYSLDQSGTGSGDEAAPGNPVTNITGGALGYFSAHTAQTKSVIVE